jgi:hypothetical protein
MSLVVTILATNLQASTVWDLYLWGSSETARNGDRERGKKKKDSLMTAVCWDVTPCNVEEMHHIVEDFATFIIIYPDDGSSKILWIMLYSIMSTLLPDDRVTSHNTSTSILKTIKTWHLMKYFVQCNHCERTTLMLKLLTFQEVYWSCW